MILTETGKQINEIIRRKIISINIYEYLLYLKCSILYSVMMGHNVLSTYL